MDSENTYIRPGHHSGQARSPRRRSSVSSQAGFGNSRTVELERYGF